MGHVSYLYLSMCDEMPLCALSLLQVGKGKEKKSCVEDKVRCDDCRGRWKEDEDREVQAPSQR